MLDNQKTQYAATAYHKIKNNKPWEKRHTLLTCIQLFFSSSSLLFIIFFGMWWFMPQHIPHNFLGAYRIFDVVLFMLVSYIIWHPLIMEVLSWCISSHIKKIPKQKPIAGLKVAFITTIVPKNEPLDLLHRCLPAMVHTKYPHDTWILDEGNSEAVKQICNLYGVYHFSRYGRSKYNTKTGKFTKTKGGNHNSWYETYGNSYDIVAQIDTDFVPSPDFLLKTLGYFRNPTVAFVGTPQIYGNTQNSLVALGAAEQQYNFYGAILRGLSGMGMTLLIGANHVIRVSAFKKVGHYTAHLTEDLITGIKLHAHGYKSIYVPYPLAVGEGPSTWESYFNQQLRWAYGCIDILFHHSPKYFKRMGLRQTLYYFFLQQHYFSGVVMALSLLLLLLYFLFGLRAADVDIFTFFIYYSLALLVSWLMSIWLQRYDINRKREGELFLAGKIISIAAWPIWFLAFLNVLRGKPLQYKVTPKGENDEGTTSPAVFIPHFIFAAFAFTGLIVSFFTHRQSSVMLFWAFSSLFLMLLIPFAQDVAYTWSHVSLKVLSGIRQFSLHPIPFTHFMHKTSQTRPFIHKKLAKTHTMEVQDTTFSPVVRMQEVLWDCFFLLAIITASCVLYITKIGFYSDDWSFLGNFTVSQNQSLIGFVQTATTPNTFMRPMQNIYDAVLFWLFGTQPLGYQLINYGVFGAIIILLYVILRKVRLPRIIAFTVSLVFALLPNYSTDRFWYAAFQVNLSLLFFLFSTYAGLNAFASRNTTMFVWKILSIFSLIISILSYEVVLPLVLFNMVLFWNPIEKIKGDKKQFSSNHTVFITLNAIILLYLVIFKIKTTTRMGNFNYPGDVAHLVSSIVHTNFGTLGLHLPYIWGEIITRYATAPILTLTFVVYLAVFLYLYFFILKPTSQLPTPLFMRNTAIFGILLFLLGYAIFFANNKVGFSPIGIDNRVAIAAALGIAFILVGSIGWISSRFLSVTLSHWLFSFLIALSCAGSFLTVTTIASFWAAAYQRSSAVLTDIQMHFPSIPSQSTLLLDGVCPYVGPGIVFESQWDLKGALQTIYHDPTLKADIVTPRLSVTPKNIVTQIYTFKAYYPYTKLFIYNYRKKKTVPIPNAQAAYTYFQHYNPDLTNGCPSAIAGNGVSVF